LWFLAVGKRNIYCGYIIFISFVSGKIMEHNLEDGIIEIVGKENIRLEEPMSKHTTFQIGGPARIFVTPETVEELGKIIIFCNTQQLPFFVLGNGSNLLVSDKGMDGVVIQLYHNFSDFCIEGTKVTAQAGVMLASIGNAARDAGLTGFEFAAGIPGTLGGAVMMNAGAYGGEMKDIIKKVRLMDRRGNVLEKSCEEMDFSYRHSVVEDEGYIVLEAEMELAYGDKAEIDAKMRELAKARRTKQPLEFPSAGSTFKRPEGYFAGKLIMDAGLRGYSVGGAQVSEKHCGFVINRGGATAQDVMDLIQDVQDKVYEDFQVRLEPEVKLVGRG
jgi:UDP-N-acetylmuramate dehydrogenase